MGESQTVLEQSPIQDGHLNDELLDEIVRRIVAVAAPEQIILFGSAARDEMGPDSDVDLLVVKPDIDRRKTAQQIEVGLGDVAIPTDVLVVTPEDLERHKDTIGLIYHTALAEGKTIYAA